MVQPDKAGKGTRERLLEAACRVFADKGYRAATIAEICERAGANIAAVNYHFGDKASLYVEAWRHSFEASLRAHPPGGGARADDPPEERLRARILALLRRIMSPGSPEFAIVRHEMGNPTGLLHEAMRKAIEPLRRGTFEVVRQLLGDHADDHLVHLCMRSIISQCMHVMHRDWHRGHFGKGPVPPQPPAPPYREAPEKLADHITRFSLAGLREVRRGMEEAAAREGDAP